MRQRASMHQGFTLIELLVVVAIIAVLVAILLPSMVQARAQARKVQCLSKQRQLGIGFQSYSIEYTGHYPAPIVDHWNRWYHYLLPFIGLGSYDSTKEADRDKWDFAQSTTRPEVRPDILKCTGRSTLLGSETEFGFRMNSLYFGTDAGAPFGEMVYGLGRLGGGGNYNYQGYFNSENDFSQGPTSLDRAVLLFESEGPGNTGSFIHWFTCHPGGSNVLAADGSATFWQIDVPDDLAVQFSLFGGGWWWYWNQWPGYQIRFASPSYYLKPLPSWH